MFKAEQLNLFEIEPEDSLAVYGTDSIPYIVITSTTSTMIKTKNFSLNMWTYGAGGKLLVAPRLPPSPSLGRFSLGVACYFTSFS